MLKKLIASASVAAVALSSFGSNLVLGAPAVTDPELIDAVSWGYDAGLTSYSDADAFMSYNNLTREQFAKFASEFADSVLGLEADSNANCSFADASSADQTLTDSMTKACQQGLMMGYEGNFMPKQLVTRGQVATVVSRMLDGIDPMASEQSHFDYLNSLGIMNVANLSSSIVRGDAMLMLYRVANGSNEDLCLIDPTLPGCDDDNNSTVKQGDLQISLNPSSPANGSSVPSTGSSMFAKVDFTAGGHDVTLSTVSLTRGGLGTYSDVNRVYFEKNGVRVSSKAAVSSDNKVVLSFAPALKIAAGQTVTLDLYADLEGQAGGEHNFSSTVVNSSAANVAGSFVTPTLRAAAYTVADVTFDATTLGNTYQINGQLVELGEFRLANPTRDVTFKAITLTNSGVANLEDLSGVVLQRNGVTISTEAVVNGRNLTLVVNNDSVLNGQNAIYTIKGIINNVDREGDSYQFRLKNTSDINVVETVTSFRARMSSSSDYVMGNYVVKGADVKLATNAGFVTTVRAPQGASNVVLMSGTIFSKTDITLEDVKLLITSSGGASTIAKKLTLTIGGSTFTYSTTNTGSQTGTFDGTVVVPAGQTLPVVLVADTIENTAPANYWLQVATLNPAAITTKEYVSNGDAVTSMLGSVQGARVTVQPTNLQVTNSLTAAQTVVKGSNNVAVLTPKFATSYDNAVRVNQFSVDVSTQMAGTTWYLKDANGTVIANATKSTAGAGTVTFSNLNLNVTKAAPISTTVVVDSIPSDWTGTVALTVTGVNAVDTSTSNSVTPALPAAKSVTITDTASVTATAGTNNTRLVYAGQTAVAIGTVALKASNSEANVTKLNVKLNSANLTGINASNLIDVTIKDGSTVVPNAFIASGADELVFDSMNYAIPAGQTKTLTVYATIPALNTTGELTATTFGLQLLAGTFTSANQESNIAGSQIMSSGIKVIKTKLVVSNPAKAQGGNMPAMSFVMTPTDGNTVSVTGFSFLVSPNNVTLTGSQVIVSSALNGGGTVYATGTVGGALTPVNAVSVSSATTVYVTVKTVTNWNASGAANAGNINISLTDFTYSDSVSNGDVEYAGIYAPYANELGANISATLTQ